MNLVIVAWRKLSYRTLLLTKALPHAKLWFFRDSVPYLRAMFYMFMKCLKHKPNTLLIQLPQGLLLFEAVLLKKLLRIHVVADVHTGFIFCSGLKEYLLNRFFVWFLGSVDLVLVHNKQMKTLLSPKVRRKTIVVYDPWMFISTPDTDATVFGDEYLVFPASFSPDEPLREVCECVNKLGKVKLFVTGDYRRQRELLRFRSKYVRFTGFLSRQDYENLLANSSGIITGSKREFTLCMSSWEAVAYKKPLFLTDTAALKSLFKDYAVFFDWRDNESLVSALKSDKKDLSMSRKNLYKLTLSSLQQLVNRPEVQKA